MLDCRSNNCNDNRKDRALDFWKGVRDDGVAANGDVNASGLSLVRWCAGRLLLGVSSLAFGEDEEGLIRTVDGTIRGR